LGNGTDKTVDKEKTFSFIELLPAGKWLLFLVGVGLLCYVLWRVIQLSLPEEKNSSKFKEVFRKLRYVFSGIVYLSLALLAFKKVFQIAEGGSGSKQQLIESIMQTQNGALLIGLAGFALAAVGIYQIYYSLSESYKKHVSLSSVDSKSGKFIVIG